MPMPAKQGLGHSLTAFNAIPPATLHCLTACNVALLHPLCTLLLAHCGGGTPTLAKDLNFLRFFLM